MSVRHIENNKSLFDITYVNPLVVIDFSATWCVPCKRIAPDYDKLSTQFTNWVFTKVDVDLVPDAAEFYNVTCMPTFVFIRESKVVGRIEGSDINAVAQKLSSLSV